MSWLAVYLCPRHPGGLVTFWRSAGPAGGPSRCASCGQAVELVRLLNIARHEEALGITPPANLPPCQPGAPDPLELTPEEWARFVGERPAARA